MTATARTSADPLFDHLSKLVEPETLLDRLFDSQDDEFYRHMQAAVDHDLEQRTSGIDIRQLRGDVYDIDDASQIELSAFKVGFLFGVEFLRRIQGAAGERGAR